MNSPIAYINKWMEQKSRKMTIKRNLKIYQSCVKSCANLEISAVKHYEEEKFFHFFALLLQVVSFFTTYAGVAMYFGNVFDLAPLFIALTIQGVLYLTAVSAFQPGKKNRRKRVALILCTFISVAFSYTGLVTLANSPLTDYKRAYDSYVDTFQALKEEVSQENLDVDSLAADISNEYLKTINTLQALDRRISQLTQIAEAEITIPSTNRTTQTTTMPDGTVVRGNTTTANPDYALAVEARQEAAAQALEVDLVRDDLYHEVLDAVNAAGELTVESETYSDIRTAVQWEKIAERIREMESETTMLQNFRQEYFRVANKNNSAVSTIIRETESETDMTLYTMEAGLLDSGLDMLGIYQDVKMITITPWEEIAAVTFSEEKTGAAGVIDQLGQAVGADLFNSDMKELMDCYQKLKEAVIENYSQVTAALPQAEEYARYRELSGEKENILAQPEILVIAFERFTDPEYAGSAVCCMILALLNDFSTVLLGWLGTRKGYALTDGRKQKESPDDTKELFPMVFTALQSQFVLKIRTGQFMTMDREAFAEECYSYVNEIIRMVQQFIAKFVLSPCTAQMGYNLVWRYYDESETKPFLPVISLLLKTGLLKVLPISQYEYLEMEYYLGKTGHLWIEDIGEMEDLTVVKEQLTQVKEKGHILLLRNKTERYLRENLADSIRMEVEHE